MAEFAIELGAMGFGIGIDFQGDGFQGLKMRIRIAIAKGMIRDDVEAAFQEDLEFGVHELSIFSPQ